MSVALDTSVAVPLLHQKQRLHQAVSRWAAGRDVVLSGHAAAETYSVLTRLPGELRLSPEDASTLIGRRLAAVHLLPDTVANLTDTLGSLAISGGAVYDALVALAARDHDLTLATRDDRARSTYDALGVRVVVVPG